MLERFFPPPLQLGLASRGLALVSPAQGAKRQGACWEKSWLQAPGEAPDFELLLTHLESVLNEASAAHGRPVKVVLSDAWARLWVARPPGNALRRQDCEAAAAARFEALYGEPLGDKFRLSADWSARRPFVAAALETSQLQSLQARLEAFGLEAESIQPHFVTAWNGWRRAVPDGAWFGTLHEDMLTFLMLSDEAPMEVRRLKADASAQSDAGWLHQTLQREALRLSASAPACIALAGAVPAAWSAAQGPDWRCVALESLSKPFAQAAMQLVAPQAAAGGAAR
ncbi:MAG: hypothetical protein JO370_13505 [Paucibacter sp.]|nr:hypothetical protein [Roseateles sp.]